eukprot:SAG31_NODE_2110_length_6426_cov_6.371898_10_plen_261_part_01
MDQRLHRSVRPILAPGCGISHSAARGMRRGSVGPTVLLRYAAVLLLPPTLCAAIPAAAFQRPTSAVEAAAGAAHGAENIGRDLPVAAALRSVGLATGLAASTGCHLNELGFATALDLRLLGGGVEGTELMDVLKTEGHLSIGNRAKLRLLIGDRGHMGRLTMQRQSAEDQAESDVSSLTFSRWDDSRNELPQRRLQRDASSNELSLDTIAIVISVMLGIAGYVVQGVPLHPCRAAAASSMSACMPSCHSLMKRFRTLRVAF